LALAKHLWKQTFIPFGLDKKCPDNATYPQRDGEFRMIDVKWQHWIAKNIEELIVRSQHLPPYILTKQRVHKAIVKCINRLFYGNVDRFAKLLKLRKADLRTWYEGISTPSFEEILHICQFLKTSFLDFLTGDWLELTKPSRSDPAHQLTFKRLREKLEKALSSKDAVPPSFREVALATGYDAAFLFNSFPELCIQLVRRDKELKNNPRIQSLRRQRRDVRKATIECLDYHRYPTLFDVREKLRKFSDPDILEDEDTLATWHKTLKELGLAPYKGENACESMYLDCWMRNHYED
jgi:transcriptional regulator with XRE-family HTH domain